MNKMSWILFLFLIISLGENIYFFQYNSSQGKSSGSKAPAEKQAVAVTESNAQVENNPTTQSNFEAISTQQSLANSYFKIGSNRAKNGESEKTACAFEKTHLILYCLQGYYFEKSTEDIATNTSPKSLDSKEFNYATFAAKEISIGMAYASLNKPVSTHSPYQVDGWAYIKAINDISFRNNIADACKNVFTADMQKYCLWGAGRGLSFLNKSMKANSTDSDANKLIPQGTAFASTFLQALKDANTTNLEEKSPKTSAFLIMNQFYDKKTKLAKIPAWSKCLSEKHVADCL